MKLSMDEYIGLDTIIHRWEPKTKFIGIMILVFTFSFINNIFLVPFMIVVSAVLFIMSGLPLSYLLTRWIPPALFIIVMSLLFIFFTEGAVWFNLGPLAVKKEGVKLAFLMISRFLSIITLIVVLFGSTSFLTILKAMRSIGLPQIMADMIMFAYRYIFEIGSNLSKMQTSMKLKGFKGRSVKNIYCFASLAGTILIRSYEQSGRIYEAMTLKGYGQGICMKNEFKTEKKDKIILLSISAFAIILLILQFIINR